jgi:hypothetical protein
MIARQGSQARCGLRRSYALLFGVILHGRRLQRGGQVRRVRGVGNHLSGLDLNQRFLLQLGEMLELKLTKQLALGEIE